MRLKRLSEIQSSKDIFGDCSAISCGVFCPTFGVSVCAPLIQDGAVLIVGTPECTWYAKNSSIYHAIDPGWDRFYCCAMEEQDITFGENGAIVKAICDIAAEPDIHCIFLASTCVPEIIGDDLEAIAKAGEKLSGIPVLPVRIAHYDHKCNEFGVAVSRTLESLGSLMEAQPKQPKTVNLLGRNFHSAVDGSLRDTELVKLLQTHGIAIQRILPDRCSTSELKKAPSVALNIVTNEVGRELAYYMEKHFGIPYVLFEPSFDLDYIRAGYDKLQKCLGISMEQELCGRKREAKAAIHNGRRLLQGKSFINGGRPPDAFEAAEFLAEMGMKPLLIHAYRLCENSSKRIEKILQRGWNPYVNYVANPEGAAALTEELAPDIYIGHGDAERLIDRGIKQIEMLLPPGKLGYEAIVYAVSALTGVGRREFI